MGKIKILADNLCNQIAAGEVVERPAAVLKELLENSIDAGSRKIAVTLLAGGRKEIRVVDDGEGMHADDALLALERHATSKIRTVEDLQSIGSLGFRGEALPSIAAVTRFELITRQPEAIAGSLIRVDGGVLRDVRETGCPPGTAVTARDLFHNLPARRKFLRSIDTEMAHISEQFQRLAMAHPQIHFQLTHQNRLQYDFTQTRDFAERAAQIFGLQLSAGLYPFAEERPAMKVHGLVGPPRLQRANSRSLFVYVNGRPVWDRSLNHAILTAYDTLLPKGRYPLAVVFLSMEPALVDVNVHPTKREVRFRSGGEVIETVRTAIRNGLRKTPGGVPGTASGPFAAMDEPRPRRTLQGMREDQGNLTAADDAAVDALIRQPPMQARAFAGGAPPPAADRPRTPEQTPPEPGPAGGFFSGLNILGQLANTYILLEAPDGLVLLDQHAAHERIMYERLSAAAGESIGRQRLSNSVVVEFLPQEAAALRRWLDSLLKAGFEIEAFGGNSFVIQAVPAALSGQAPDALLRELLATAHEAEEDPHWDVLAGLVKTASCHAAIRAGQRLQIQEIRALLEALDRAQVSATCPHGRPLWHKLTHGDIARFFHRT